MKIQSNCIFSDTAFPTDSKALETPIETSQAKASERRISKVSDIEYPKLA